MASSGTTELKRRSGLAKPVAWRWQRRFLQEDRLEENAVFAGRHPAIRCLARQQRQDLRVLSATVSLARSGPRVTQPANQSLRDRVNPILAPLCASLIRGQALPK